jgi:hypothetical protein
LGVEEATCPVGALRRWLDTAAVSEGDFAAFAARIGRRRQPAEPETVVLYVADLARRGRRPATIARKLAAIAVFHRAAGEASPPSMTSCGPWSAACAANSGLPSPQKTALGLEPLRTVLARCCSSAGPPRCADQNSQPCASTTCASSRRCRFSQILR